MKRLIKWFKKKPAHSFKFEDLSAEDKQLHTACIRKFYLTKLPIINEISKLPALKEHFGSDIQSLGIERGLEACFELFEEGAFELIAQSEKNFVVLIHLPHEVQMIFRVEEGKVVMK